MSDVAESASAVNPGDNSVTFINVIEIPADQVDVFITGWRERTQIVSAIPGFRDYKLHRAITADSRFQLVNVAHWDSREAFQAAIANPQFRSRMQALNEDPSLDVAASPALYRVAVSDGRDGAGRDHTDA